MLFQYWIGHEGQQENKGYAVAETGDEAIEMAKARFPGWAVGSYAGGKAIVSKVVKVQAPIEPIDLSWIHPSFRSM